MTPVLAVPPAEAMLVAVADAVGATCESLLLP